MQRLITPNHVIVPCPRLYTLILTFTDTTPQQILGLNPAFLELENTGDSLRQSLILITIIIINTAKFP